MEFNLVVILALGAWATYAGCRAYSGRWRAWRSIPGLLPKVRSYPGLGLLYAGIGFLAGAAAVAVGADGAPRPLLAGLLIIMLAGLGIFLLSFVWLPRLMRPAWVRAEDETEQLQEARP